MATFHTPVIHIKNDTTDRIPAWGIAKVTGLDGLNAEGQPILKVKKADGLQLGVLYVVAIGKDIDPAETAVGVRINEAIVVACTETGLQAGDEIGPMSGQWTAGSEGFGLVLLDAPANGIAAVMPIKSPNVQVEYDEDLHAAENSKRDPSYAMATVLRKKANGDLTRSSTRIRVVNRAEQISVDKGRWGKCEPIDQEWQPYVADCPPDGSSSSSGV